MSGVFSDWPLGSLSLEHQSLSLSAVWVGGEVSGSEIYSKVPPDQLQELRHCRTSWAWSMQGKNGVRGPSLRDGLK